MKLYPAYKMERRLHQESTHLHHKENSAEVFVVDNELQACACAFSQNC